MVSRSQDKKKRNPTKRDDKRNKKPGERKMEAPPLTDGQKKWLANYRQMDPMPCVADFLQRGLMRDKPVEKLVIEFKAHSHTLNSTRNRYKDIRCLDNNRVILQLG